VTYLCLQLRELSGFLTQKQNQSLKFVCRVVRVVGRFQHQLFEFSR
jgi:hypothetical protein